MKINVQQNSCRHSILVPRLEIMFDNLQAEETDVTVAETKKTAKSSHVLHSRNTLANNTYRK